MKKSLLPALRKELENSFGRKILSSRDCLQMVEDIYQKTGYSINANTLRRFFGLVKTAYSASPSTLTILSKYCGFNSIDEIENITSADLQEDNINKEEVLHYLSGLFRQLPLNSNSPASVASIVQQTVHFLERNPSLIDRFQREIAKTPSGQYHYFELAVNMDRLNGYFGDGLRYYLRAKNTDDARVFNHSLQVFRYWLTDNQSLMETNMSVIQSLPSQTGYSPHIMGRLLAARLYYANARNESMEKILSEATKYHVSAISKREGYASGYPFFELAISEALVLTGQFEEALEFIRRGKTSHNGSMEPGMPEPFRLWEQIIYSQKNNNPKKPDLTHKLQFSQPENLHINKKYNNLVYTVFNSKKQGDLLHNMIKETGFTKFNTIAG